MSIIKRRSAAIIVMILANRFKNQNRKRRLWVRQWIQRRQLENSIEKLIADLKEDGNAFKDYFRMSPEKFDFLLDKVRPIIAKKDTHFRKAISPASRLSVTLRYLVSGDSYRSLTLLYGIPHNTISGIVSETCKAIYNTLCGEYLKVCLKQIHIRINEKNIQLIKCKID